MLNPIDVDLISLTRCSFRLDNSDFRQWNQNGTNLEPEWNHSIE